MIERHYFAGDTQIKARGRFFRYAAGPAAGLGLDERITVVVDGYKAGVMLPGDSIELDEAADRWELFPAAPGAAGEVEIGQGIVRSARVAGAVETWPGDVRKALGGACFWNMNTRTPGAGNYAVNGVVASGGRVAVRAFRVGSGTTMSQHIWRATGVPDVYASLQAFWSKRLMAPQSARAMLVAADSTTNSFTAPEWGATTMGAWQALGAVRSMSDVRDLLQTVPLILESGEGLYAVAQAAAQQGAVEIEVEEL